MDEIQVLILVVLILFSAFFSGVETALISLSKVKVKSLLKQGRRGSKALYRLKKNHHKLLITILIGNNLVNIAAASFATIIFTDLFGSSGIGIATGVMTFLILVFGEITPKTFAAQNAEKVSLIVARPIELLSFVLSPFVIVFELISRFAIKLVGLKSENDLSEYELKTIVTMGKEEGILSRESAEMMHNVLEFEGTKVVEIMTPKVDVLMLDGNLKLKKVLDFLIKTPYSKYPVFFENRDKIIGVLDVDDVLKYVRDDELGIKVMEIVNPVYFVPESKKIDDLLTEFEGKKIPMAVVVNEYGLVSGLVTVEDILEEIVGDIFDKSKRNSVYIKKINDKLIRVDAKISIEEINKVLNLGLKEGHFDTIAGFIEHKLQKIPKKGEKIVLSKFTIEVDKVTDQGIKIVNIIKT